jgi:hypothetical protein
MPVRASRETAAAKQGPKWTFFGIRQIAELMSFPPRRLISIRFPAAETDEVAIRALAFAF